MEESMMMRACTRKLALWHTKTFKPIMTHDELEPIMATLGFVALPLTPSSSSSSSSAAAISAVVVWKEYAYGGGSCRSGVSTETAPAPPRPRLPYPRIDGLHIYTYQAFIDALTFYLHMTYISDLFHIRGMPLHRIHDRNKKLRRMDEDDSVFVYREGTLDQATYDLYHDNDINNNTTTATNINDITVAIGNGYSAGSSFLIRNEDSHNSTIGPVVPL